MLRDLMRFSFNHRALLCYLAMSVWVFFLITANYKYVSLKQQGLSVKKKPGQSESIKTEKNLDYQKILDTVCNPIETIAKGSEGICHSQDWIIQGALVLTRHGDRGPLTHIKNGTKLPCDQPPFNSRLKSYKEFVSEVSKPTDRAPWSAAAGPFHNFPTLPAENDRTRCPLGQLTPTGLAQMLSVGEIINRAYSEELGFGSMGNNLGHIETYSTRYRRTYMSLLGTLWAAVGGTLMPQIAAKTVESPSLAFCFNHCACPAMSGLKRKINARTRSRLESHPEIKYLVNKLYNIMSTTKHETFDPELVKDQALAYMCHQTDLPCGTKPVITSKHKRRLHQADDIFIHNEYKAVHDNISNLDNNNKEAMENSRDDFDARVEKDKLEYYQHYVNANIDTEDGDNDEEEKTYTDKEQVCILPEDLVTLFKYLESVYKEDAKDENVKKLSLLQSYGFLSHLTQQIIKMISFKSPELVIYSCHDKTLVPLLIALGVDVSEGVNYAARLIFELYKKFDSEHLDKVQAQDYYFRVVYNGDDVTRSVIPCQSTWFKATGEGRGAGYLCPVESMIRFIHDGYFSKFNATNYRDACTNHNHKRHRG